MYKRQIQDALTLTRDWSLEEVNSLRDTTPREGLNAKINGQSLREIGREVLGISRRGLVNRAAFNSEDNDESHFLAPLEESIARGTTLAEEMLALYNGRWNGSVDPVFVDYAY